MKREPIYGLDLIRFAAACSVVVWHLGYRFFDPDAKSIRRMVEGIPTDAHAFTGWTQWGWAGVQTFFVISGFVIAYSTQGTTPWRFFVSRLARLWPGVLVCAFLMIAIDIFYWRRSPLSEAVEFARSMLFYPSGPWISPQYWTLPVEVAFYGIVWIVLATRRAHWIDYLSLLILLVCGSYWSWTLILESHLRPDIANILLLNHGCYFAIGMSLSALCRQRHNAIAYIVIAGSILVAIPQMQYSLQKYGVTGPGQFRWAIPYGIWLMSVGVIYLSMLWRVRISEAMSRRLWLARSLRSIGVATFPLYLLHIHVGGLVATLLVTLGWAPVTAVILGGLTCIPLSIAVAEWGEPPLRRVLVSYLSKVQPFFDRIGSKLFRPPLRK